MRVVLVGRDVQEPKGEDVEKGEVRLKPWEVKRGSEAGREQNKGFRMGS